MEQHHITHINDTFANLQTSMDEYQYATITDESDVIAGRDGSGYIHATATQYKSNNGGASRLYQDATFANITATGSVYTTQDLAWVTDTDHRLRWASGSCTITVDGSDSLVMLPSKIQVPSGVTEYSGADSSPWVVDNLQLYKMGGANQNAAILTRNDSGSELMELTNGAYYDGTDFRFDAPSLLNAARIQLKANEIKLQLGTGVLPEAPVTWNTNINIVDSHITLDAGNITFAAAFTYTTGNFGVVTVSPGSNIGTTAGDIPYSCAHVKYRDFGNADAAIVVEGSGQAHAILSDASGGTDDKNFEMVSGGGVTTLRSLKDDLTERKSIITMDWGTARVSIGPTTADAVLTVSGGAVLTGETRYELVINEKKTYFASRGGGIALALDDEIRGGIRAYGVGSDDSRIDIQCLSGGTLTTRFTVGDTGYLRMINGTFPTALTNQASFAVLSGEMWAQNQAGARAMLTPDYGSLYQHDTGTTITISTINTDYIVTGFGTGVVKGLVPQSGQELKVVAAGTYVVHWQLSLTAPSANQELEGDVGINGTASTQASCHRKLSTGTDSGNMGGSAILTLAANDLIQVTIRNETSTANVIIGHAQLAAYMLGG